MTIFIPTPLRPYAGGQQSVDVGDIEAMAQGVLGLLNDRERTNAMREAARRAAKKRFCSTLVVPRYVRYYEQVLGRQS